MRRRDVVFATTDVQPYDAGQMESYMVSRIVNSPTNDKAECIEPAHE